MRIRNWELEVSTTSVTSNLEDVREDDSLVIFCFKDGQSSTWWLKTRAMATVTCEERFIPGRLKNTLDKFAEYLKFCRIE